MVMIDNIKATCESNCKDDVFGITGGITVVVFARTLLMVLMTG